MSLPQAASSDQNILRPCLLMVTRAMSQTDYEGNVSGLLDMKAMYETDWLGRQCIRLTGYEGNA